MPESVLKRRKTREAVRAARLQISIKVFIKYLINIFFKNVIFNYLKFLKIIKMIIIIILIVATCKSL